MRFIDTNTEPAQFPGGSISGDNSLPSGVLLDTGWEIAWEGPGHAYLSIRDVVDIVVPSLEQPDVQEALKANGWTEPGATADKVAELEAELEETRNLYAEAKTAEDGFDAALKKLQSPKTGTHPHKPAASAAKQTTKAKE